MEGIRAIPSVLQVLEETSPPGGKVMSLYLDTSPIRVEREAYLLAYRDLIKALRQEVPESEQKTLEAAATRAEGFLVNEFSAGHPGLAIFAAAEPEYFYPIPLPRRPLEQMSWDSRPHLEPLREILDDNERVAVALFDSRRARLFTVFLGEVEERLTIEDQHLPKEQAGGWAALRQSRLGRRHDDRLVQHAKHTVAELTSLLRTSSFDRLLIGGPEEPLAVLRHHLTRSLRDRLAGELHLELFASDHDVREAVLRAATASERASEVAMVDELFDAATKARAALGPGQTLAALSENRVHLLFVADSFDGPGEECSSCGYLSAVAGPCPSCRGPMDTVVDLRERVIQRALAQGARVEVVSGDAAALLLTRGGLGAWTRY